LSPVRLPYWLGYIGGLSFDLLAKLTGKKFSVSAVRIKKFCLPRSVAYRGATTQFDVPTPRDCPQFRVQSSVYPF